MQTSAFNPLMLKGKPEWKELDLPVTYADGRSFVMGDNSEDRLMVRYFVRERDNRFFAKIYFGSAAQGPPGFAHGGSIAAALDEAMGFAAWIAGFLTPCISLLSSKGVLATIYSLRAFIMTSVLLALMVRAELKQRNDRESEPAT